jgi:hypothetical protein
MLLKLFYKIVWEEMLSNSCYEVRITLISKSDKDTKNLENNILISLMTVDAKILNKIFVN